MNQAGRRGKLKAAMVVRNFSPNGGLELYAHKVIEGLLDGGIEVTVFCQTSETDFSHPLLSIKPIALRPKGLNKAQRLEHDFDAGNRALINVASEFDIVHSQHYPTRFANVATFHNHAVLRWSAVGMWWEKLINDTKYKLVKAYRLRDLHDRILCQNAAVVVFPSRVMKEDYFQSYPFMADEEKPWIVAYPGAALVGTTTPESRPAEIRNRPYTFLFVGRGYRRKGLDILMDACARLSADGEDFRLLIAGLKEKPIDSLRIKLKGLSGRITYLGFRQDMHAVYAQAEAAILPSRVEPFGMAPLQAAQFGLVPIVSRVSGASEVIENGSDGLVLENHLDSQELANLMKRLIHDTSLHARLSRNAIHNAGAINWNRTVEQTLQAYDSVLSRTNGPREAALK